MRPSYSIAVLLLGVVAFSGDMAQGYQEEGASSETGVGGAVPVLPTVEIPKNRLRPNETIIDATPLPGDKAPRLDYRDQTSNFSIGATLTGNASGATGNILADDDQGTSGTLTISQVQGEFQEGEAITGSEGGAATASSTLDEGVWVLDFAFKPLRTRTVEIPGLGRRQVLYLYYRVINRTGKPRMFVPQFFLETDEGKRYPDTVLPQAVDLIKAREHSRGPFIGAPLLGAVSITGMIPPSDKETVDKVVHGVALWIVDQEIAKSDSLTVYVRGLSNGLKVIQTGAEDGESTVKYKTLRIDFARPGDEFDYSERELQLLDTEYEWIYD